MNLLNKVLLCPILIAFMACNSGSDKKTEETAATEASEAQTYKEKVKSVKEIEKADPRKFLSVNGTYNKTMFGGKLKLHGKIKNSATAITFKEALIKVTFYDKEKTVLVANQYTINDSFPPSSERDFDIKTERLRGVDSVSWNMIGAKSSGK